ncbi:MAG: ATPase, T2SS/T4P/T4SS family [Sulfolobales archaeon]
MREAFKQIYVIDYSALLEIDESIVEIIRKRLENTENKEVHILRSLIEKLEERIKEGDSQASRALDEFIRLRDHLESEGIEVRIISDLERIRAGRSLEQLARDYAYEIGGILVTADPLQEKIAETLGLEVVRISRGKEKLLFEKYFDDNTMSVHLKAGAPPRAKKGSPARWFFEYLDSKPLTSEEVERIVSEILEEVKVRGRGFLESERPYSAIIQVGLYRIVIVRPPLSDTLEVTITRPVAMPTLESYNLNEKLIKRFLEKAEGILIAGAPGMGKTTFAQALARFYIEKGKIVKTIESPRDMHLPDEVSQYSKSKGSSEELHDILLLSRPDYTVFDEMRDDRDFELYVDLRLAGIGMVGVLHATSPIDAIQRFLRRVDLGMIPSIVDTVIFINKGRVEKIYELELTVKLPTGLKEIELARPVVEVRDVESGELEYEIYTFGEQTVIVPVRRIREESGSSRDRKMYEEIKRHMPEAEIEREGEILWISIPRTRIASLGKNFVKLKKKLEKKYNVVLRVRVSEKSV